jgi:hypothetical protein
MSGPGPAWLLARHNPGNATDAAYYLGEAEKYRKKAEAASEPGLTAAFETVAREYMAKARELDPAQPSP